MAKRVNISYDADQIYYVGRKSEINESTPFVNIERIENEVIFWGKSFSYNDALHNYRAVLEKVGSDNAVRHYQLD